MQNTHEITASLKFLERSPLYEKEKPYTIDHSIPVWEADIERTNIRTNAHEVVITDIRGKEDQFTFDANGFAIIEMESEMTYEDFQDRNKVEAVFCEEMASSLLQYFNDAAAIRVFDIEIRRRHPLFPDVPITSAVPPQPAKIAHIDGTNRACLELLKELEDANKNKRHIFINVWRPLKGPLRDWPLAICDATSVAPEDMNDHDRVFADLARENVLVHYSINQRWYYLSNQLPSELWLFRQTDSQNRPGVPHTAFDLPRYAGQHPTDPRESVEARVVVCFEG